MGLAAPDPGVPPAPEPAPVEEGIDVRRGVDILLGAVVLLVALPLLAAAALGVLITSGRPVFYGHERIGRYGRRFRCWKLRTMERDAEERLDRDAELRRRYVENGYKLPVNGDPRITALGRWLRRSRLDELPQLVNVLNGTMSMVGPRPVVEEELAEFAPHAGELLSVRPGIFGAWTSMGRARPGYPKRARVELEYIRARGPRRDLGILVRSVPVVLTGPWTGEPSSTGSGRGTGAADLPSPDAAPPRPAPAEAAGLRRVLVSTLHLLLAYLLPRVATFAAAVIAARAVGVAAFGAYGTAAALAVILSIAATLGMMQLLVRELAQEPHRAATLVGAANVAKAGSSLAMLVMLAVLAGPVLGYPADVVAAALLLGLGYAVGAYAENLGAYFQSIERMDVWMQAQAVFGIVAGSVGIALVLATRSIVWFSAAPLVGQIGALAWLLVRAPRPVRTAWRAPQPEVLRLLRSLMPFAAAFIVLTAYYKVDILLLEWLRGEGQAGLYAAAYKFVDIGQALALVVATAVYPGLARRAGNPDQRGGRSPRPGGVRSPDRAATRVVELVLLAGVPAAAVLWLLSGPVMATLFGAGYAGATPVLSLLAPVLPLMAVNAVGLFILAAARRMAVVAGLYAAALVLNLGLNAALIPELGARGAALAMLGSELALAGGTLGILYRGPVSRPDGRTLVAVLAAVLAPGLLADAGLPAGIGVAAYVTVVGLVYVAARVVSGDELELLRLAARRKMDASPRR